MSKLQNVKYHLSDMKERLRRMFMKEEEKPVVTLLKDGRLQFSKPATQLLNISEGDAVAVYENDDTGSIAIAKCHEGFLDRGYPVKGGKDGRELFIRSTNYFEHRRDLYGVEVVYEIFPLHYFDHGEMIYRMSQIRPKPAKKKRAKK